MKILVVDDNVDSAAGMAEVLRLWGYEVRTAADGKAALTVEAEFQPRVVLLDIGLPELDGYEVARRIRQQRGPEPLVLIALTGYGQDQDRQRSQDAGFDRHLVKPVDLSMLRKLLASQAQPPG